MDSDLTLCEQRLAVMARGGVNVVALPVSGASLSGLTAYAQAAGRLHLRVLWEISDSSFWTSPLSAGAALGDYNSFSVGCGCQSDAALITYMVGALSRLPETYGYYAADDSMLAPGESAGLTAYVQAVRSASRTTSGSVQPVIVSASPSQGLAYASVPAMLAPELYPVTTGSILPVGHNLATWQSVGQEVAAEARSAARHRQPAAFILQGFSFGDNLDDGEAVGVCTAQMTALACNRRLRYPSASEQLALRNAAICGGRPRLLLWWSFPGTYGQAGDDTYSIYPTGQAAQRRWAGLSRVLRAPTPPLARCA